MKNILRRKRSGGKTGSVKQECSKLHGSFWHCTQIKPEYQEHKHSRGTTYSCDQYRIDYVVMMPTGTSVQGQVVRPFSNTLNLDEVKEQVLNDLKKLVE